MGNFPYGPHGPQTPMFDGVKPATVPSNPPPPIDIPTFNPPAPAPMHFGGSYAPAADGSSYAGPGIGRGTRFVVSAIIVGVFWQFAICLYPMPALAAGIAAALSAGFLVRSVVPLLTPLNVLLAQIVGYAAAIVALYVTMRLEQKLARHIWYRIPRNIVRMIFFAILGINAVENNNGIPLFSGTNPALIPRNIANILTTPDYLLFVIVFVAVMQLIIWKAEAFRIFWHSCLVGLGLWKQ
jgi:hypothetical protein